MVHASVGFGIGVLPYSSFSYSGNLKKMEIESLNGGKTDVDIDPQFKHIPVSIDACAGLEAGKWRLTYSRGFMDILMPKGDNDCIASYRYRSEDPGQPTETKDGSELAYLQADFGSLQKLVLSYSPGTTVLSGSTATRQGADYDRSFWFEAGIQNVSAKYTQGIKVGNTMGINEKQWTDQYWGGIVGLNMRLIEHNDKGITPGSFYATYLGISVSTLGGSNLQAFMIQFQIVTVGIHLF